MALIKCENCNKEISDTSKKCVHCGTKIRKKNKERLENKSVKVKSKKKVIIIVIILVVLISGGFLIRNFFIKEEIPQTNIRNEDILQIEILNDYINIRSQMSVNSDILGKVYKDEIYDVIEKSEDGLWYLINTSNNIRGYIASQHDNVPYVKELDVKSNNQENNSNNENSEENINQESNNNTNSNNSTTNTNQNNTNNNNSNSNSNNNNQENNNSNNYEPQLKACLKTCESGYVLKNEDSVDCYCEKIQQTYVAKNQVIYNNEGVKITAKGIDYSDRNFITFDLLVENNSDIPKVIQRNHFSYVNGYDMATVYSVTLQPGTKSTSGLSYLRSTLSKNGITEINSIKIDFVIIDWDGNGLSTGKRRVTSDWININF